MSSRWLLMLCALPLLACGGEEGTRAAPEPLCRPLLPLSDQPDPGSGPVDCHALDGYEIYVMDNFEPGQARTGFYINNDRTALSDPPPETDPVPSTPIARCIGVEPSANAATSCTTPEVPRGQCTELQSPESRAALRIRTGNLTNNGGVFGRQLSKSCIPSEESPVCELTAGPPEVGVCSSGMAPTPPRHGCRAAQDFSDWDGILVWARKGPGGLASVRVRISDGDSDEHGCVCNPNPDQNDTSDGCDKFGMNLVLDGTYRAYLLPFDEMQLGGWGRPSPGLDKSNIFSVGIEYGRGAWDLWIDEIAFYRRRP